jgi:hypothetical protein
VPRGRRSSPFSVCLLFLRYRASNRSDDQTVLHFMWESSGSQLVYCTLESPPMTGYIVPMQPRPSKKHRVESHARSVVQLGVRLREKELDLLRRYAQEEGMTLAEAIRSLIRKLPR